MMRLTLAPVRTLPVLTLLVLTFPMSAAAQDTLTLGMLQDAAVQHDPRLRQLALQETASDLRLENISAQRLPQLSFTAEGSYQSDVTSLPIHVPNIQVALPPKDRYRATVNAEQLLYDGGALLRRQAVERARLAQRKAELGAELYSLRREVNEAFFTALVLQSRTAEVEALVQDLAARLDVLRAQVAAGAALPGDTAVVRAEMLIARQRRLELTANRRAALAVLTELTGRPITGPAILALPDLGREVARTRAAGGPRGVRERPRYAVFARTRERLEREAALVAAQRRPRVSAFGRAGYGRPGLARFSDDFDEFWILGVRMRWQPWNWGTVSREQRILEIRQEIVGTREAAFTDRLERRVEDDVRTMERLQAALELDDQIVALREQVVRQARVQLEERVISPARYVEIRNSLLEARLARERHRVELAGARARYLTTLGIVPR